MLTAAILAVAVNLRAPVTCVGPLVGQIRQSLGLSASAAGTLTAIPLLCFALAAPFAGKLARRFGLGRTLLAAMASVAAGTALRSWAGAAGLFLGTVMIGLGIGCGNVLLPVTVKSLYPERIGPMTSAFTTCMSLSAGLASALALGLAQHLGWRGTLAVWGSPALLASVLWFSRRGTAPAETGEERRTVNVWRSPVAWYCTLYMGTQSIFYYSSATWLPAIAAAKGITPELGGILTAVSLFMAIPANLTAPILAARLRDTRALTGAVAAVFAAGGLLLWRSASFPGMLLAVVLCGFGAGCSFSICMALIGMRTRTADAAAGLSGMLQTVGYAIAAVGPVLLGRLNDVTGSWNAPLLVMLAAILANGLVGQLAGKQGFVE